MNISELIPTLQPLVEDVNQQLRFICFFVLTAALVVRTGTGSPSIHQLMRPIITNVILCGLIATLPFWFNLIRDSFWNIAVSIRTEFTGSVNGTGAALLQLLEPPDTGVNWLDVGNSVMKSVQYALGWIIVWIGGMIQLPMMILQYVLECMCYLFLPIALSLFAFEGTKGIATRYIQQTLAILAWPIGFAVVDLVGFALLSSVRTSLTGQTIVTFNPASLVSGGVVSLWLILGSLATPVAMQALFCSGTPLSSSVGQAAQIGMSLAGMVMSGGASLSSGSATPSTPNLPPPPAPNPPPPSSPPPSLPSPSPMIPPGTQGLLQTPRGSLAVGAVADRITPDQAQSMANRSGTPFTQAFSNGQVVTHQPDPAGLSLPTLKST